MALCEPTAHVGSPENTLELPVMVRQAHHDTKAVILSLSKYVYVFISLCEDRRIMIGDIEGKIWTAIFTMRGDIIRINSVRRAREKEVSLYEKESSG
ncbi:MAG: BrnT family toxin [Nitrospirae bacterium]|nr:BrnT family toxin [Nitrospirota bacterium]